MDLDKGFQNFFKMQSGYPKFKKRGQHDSFRFPDAKQIKWEENNKRVFLPKLGWIRCRKSRSIEGNIRNATVSLCGGKWYIAIQTQRDVKEPEPRKGDFAALYANTVKMQTSTQPRI